MDLERCACSRPFASSAFGNQDSLLSSLDFRAVRQGPGEPAKGDDAVLSALSLRGREALRALDHCQLPRGLWKPGITGWAQVNGHRGETDTLEKMRRRIECDLYYIDNWSFLLDIKIIVMTLFSRRAYTNAV